MDIKALSNTKIPEARLAEKFETNMNVANQLPPAEMTRIPAANSFFLFGLLLKMEQNLREILKPGVPNGIPTKINRALEQPNLSVVSLQPGDLQPGDFGKNAPVLNVLSLIGLMVQKFPFITEKPLQENHQSSFKESGLAVALSDKTMKESSTGRKVLREKQEDTPPQKVQLSTTPQKRESGTMPMLKNERPTPSFKETPSQPVLPESHPIKNEEIKVVVLPNASHSRHSRETPSIPLPPSEPKGYFAEYGGTFPWERNLGRKKISGEVLSLFKQGPRKTKDEDFLKIIARCIVGVLVGILLIFLFLGLR